MNTKLKIICVLFAVTYLYVIGNAIISDIIPSAKTGFMEGLEEGRRLAKNEDYQVKTSESLYFFAQPENGYYSYPLHIHNLKSGKLMNAEVRQFYVKLPSSDYKALPLWIRIFRTLIIPLSFVILFIVIYIPIQSFKVIRSIVKNEIFDEKNIKRIRRVGYSLLICFGLVFLFAYTLTATSQALIGMENYKIVLNLGDDLMVLLFGFVVLLFAEILKIALKMKEENDLTV